MTEQVLTETLRRHPEIALKIAASRTPHARHFVLATLCALWLGVLVLTGVQAGHEHDRWAKQRAVPVIASRQSQQDLRAEIRALRAEMQAVLRVLREDRRRP